jgi:cytochrome P450
MNELATDRPLPAHVAAKMAKPFRFEDLANADSDPTLAAAEAVRGGPEIFYGLGVRYGVDTWVVTTHELIREVYQDAERFSSKENSNFSALLGETWGMLPLEADPPEHAQYRTMMNPIFSPKRMKAVEEDIRLTVRTLVDKALAKGEAEFVTDFAQVFPVAIFLSLMGLPLDQAPQFLEWEKGLLHSGDLAVQQQSAMAMRDYIQGVIDERRRQPTDDLVSYIVTAEVAGRPIEDWEALSLAFFLFVAGLDTVAATLGFIFKHLAEHPQDQQRLRDHPELLANAVEEFLRAYPVVIGHRRVNYDMDFHGVALKQGDRITLATMLAGRDEQAFPDPDQVDFERENVSHITFAVGPHRCIGSHLARRELRLALEEWLGRVPPFRIKPGETPLAHAIGVFGVDYLPLVW